MPQHKAKNEKTLEQSRQFEMQKVASDNQLENARLQSLEKQHRLAQRKEARLEAKAKAETKVQKREETKKAIITELKDRITPIREKLDLDRQKAEKAQQQKAQEAALKKQQELQKIQSQEKREKFKESVKAKGIQIEKAGHKAEKPKNDTSNSWGITKLAYSAASYAGSFFWKSSSDAPTLKSSAKEALQQKP